MTRSKKTDWMKRRLLTLAAAAKMLGISQAELRHLVDAGEIRALRGVSNPGFIRFVQSDVENHISQDAMKHSVT